LLALSFAIATVFINGTSAEAYGGLTHPWLTKRGVALVRNVNSSLNTLLNTDINGKTAASILINTANNPDYLTSELYPIGYSQNILFISAPHFYQADPNIKNNLYEKNYCGTSDTAKSRLETHYNNAVNYYKAGDKATAYGELGMALHYLEDLCNPHHAINATSVNSSNHNSYEYWVDLNCVGKSAYTETSVNDAVLNFVRSSSIGSIGKQMAVDSVASAKVVVYGVDSVYKNAGYTATQTSAKANYGVIAKGDLKRAQRYAAGAIYKFYLDVGEMH